MLRFIVTLFSLIVMAPLFAKDVAGSSDHPLLGRIPGSSIIKYEQKSYKTLHYPTKYENYKIQSASMAGKHLFIRYELPTDVSPEGAVAIYENKLKELGATIVWKRGNVPLTALIKYSKFLQRNLVGVPPKEVSALSAEVNLNGKPSAVFVESGIKLKKPYLLLYLVESNKLNTAMEVVTAKKIAQDIDAKGHIALYGIKFEFDSDAIMPDSQKSIKEIADYLKTHKEIALYVVGHTDNQGTYSYNLELSKRRASAVKKELIKKYGIDGKRLQAVGIGPVSPVASNDSPEGRAKNRRVELVKQ